MTLIAEDGTGLSNANALFSASVVMAQLELYGFSLTAYSVQQFEESIIRCSYFMASVPRWDGFKVNGRNQTMPFPRTGLRDREGLAVPSTAVPIEIRDGLVELVRHEVADAFSLAPSHKPNERVRSEQIGEIRVAYDMSQLTNEAFRRAIVNFNGIVGDFLANSAYSRGARMAGTAIRG